MLGLAPAEVTPEDEEWRSILNETTYDNTEDNKQQTVDRWQDFKQFIIAWRMVMDRHFRYLTNAQAFYF